CAVEMCALAKQSPYSVTRRARQIFHEKPKRHRTGRFRGCFRIYKCTLLALTRSRKARGSLQRGVVIIWQNSETSRAKTPNSRRPGLPDTIPVSALVRSYMLLNLI